MNTLPCQLLLLTPAGWVNQGEQDVMECPHEESRALREHMGRRRLHFTDGQGRRLAKAGLVSRPTLWGMETVVTPDALVRWYRTLVARKYDGSKPRESGRPRTSVDIERLIVRVARDNHHWGYARSWARAE